MNFPEDYDFHNDPSYLLAVKGKINLKRIGTNETRTLSNVNVTKLSSVDEAFWNDYDMSVFGKWNKYLIDTLRRERRGGAENQSNYKIIESFAKTGILAWPILISETEVYYYFVIPPFLALWWDDYYKRDILGDSALAAISMTPARYSILQWIKNPESFVEKSILQKTVLGKDGTSTVKREIMTLSEQINSLIDDERMKRAYVGVFGFNLRPDLDSLLLENIAFQITKPIYEAMVQQRVETLKPTLRVTLKDIKKIKEENIRKLAESEASWMEPLIVIYADPIPTPVDPFVFTSKYSSVVPAPATSQPLSESFRKAQECVLKGRCELTPTSPATGFIDFTSDPGSSTRTSTTTVDINCSTYDPVKLGVLGSEFGVSRMPNESDLDYCERAKKAVALRIQSGKQA